MKMKMTMNRSLLAAACAAALLAGCASGVKLDNPSDVPVETRNTAPEPATNANADANTITFAPGVIGTIPNSVTVGLPIMNPVTIVGPGAQILAVAGKTGTRVFTVTGANVRISGLTIKDATSGFNGGGISNSGQLTLSPLASGIAWAIFGEAGLPTDGSAVPQFGQREAGWTIDSRSGSR